MEAFILHRLEQMLSKIEDLDQRVSVLEGRRQIPMNLFEGRVGALETRIGNLRGNWAQPRDAENEADPTFADILEQVQDNMARLDVVTDNLEAARLEALEPRRIFWDNEQIVLVVLISGIFGRVLSIVIEHFLI